MRSDGAAGCKSIVPMLVCALAGLLLLVPHVVGSAYAETWKADTKLARVRSAGICLRGAESTYPLELAAGTLTGRSIMNSFGTSVAADGAGHYVFVAELDQGLNTTVTRASCPRLESVEGTMSKVEISETTRFRSLGTAARFQVSASRSTKMPRFTVTGNARMRELELAWPSGPCTWKLEPRE